MVIVRKYLLTVKDSVFMGSQMYVCIVAVFDRAHKLPVDLLFMFLENI